MTSPALKAKPRTEPEAQADREYRLHTDRLKALKIWLPHATRTMGLDVRHGWLESLSYALDKLHDAQAKELVERAKR